MSTGVHNSAITANDAANAIFSFQSSTKFSTNSKTLNSGQQEERSADSSQTSCNVSFSESSEQKATASVQLDTANAGQVTRSSSRNVRLEQNRKAAIESRRRKKVMIDELQRSVIFFSRANDSLKQQNDALELMLMQAQAKISTMEAGNDVSTQEKTTLCDSSASQSDGIPNPLGTSIGQAQSETVAVQAVDQRRGFTSLATGAAAQCVNGRLEEVPTALAARTNASSTHPSTKPSPMQMRPKAADFQQAAGGATPSPANGMQSIPGLDINQIAAISMGVNPQQTYTDTMAAFALQQAVAAAAAGSGQNQFMFPTGMPFVVNPLVYQLAQQQQESQQP